MQINLFNQPRIPLPDGRAKNRDTIDVTASFDEYFERRQFRVRMDHNDIDERWMFTAAIAGRGTVIPSKPAMLWHPYTFRSRYLFAFIDPLGEHEHITAQNLGDPVFLIVIPRPESPGYIDWVTDHFGYGSINDGGDGESVPEPDQPGDQLLF